MYSNFCITIVVQKCLYKSFCICICVYMCCVCTNMFVHKHVLKLLYNNCCTKDVYNNLSICVGEFPTDQRRAKPNNAARILLAMPTNMSVCRTFLRMYFHSLSCELTVYEIVCTKCVVQGLLYEQLCTCFLCTNMFLQVSLIYFVCTDFFGT